MLTLRFWFRHSVARASVAVKTKLAHPLHSYAHLNLPVLFLHRQLFEVYAKQVRTISGATLHHVAMAHQKYLSWATMVTHYMRAHNQWLRMACQGVEEAYLASFHKVSRNFRGDYDRTMRDWCHHSYTEARSEKQSLLSRPVSASIRHHFENEAVRLETLSDHWLTSAWFQKEHHLAMESDLVRRLLLKRKCVPSPGGMRGTRLCTSPQGETCVVQLTGSPIRPTLHFTDGIQLTGSPI